MNLRPNEVECLNVTVVKKYQQSSLVYVMSTGLLILGLYGAWMRLHVSGYQHLALMGDEWPPHKRGPITDHLGTFHTNIEPQIKGGLCEL